MEGGGQLVQIRIFWLCLLALIDRVGATLDPIMGFSRPYMSVSIGSESQIKPNWAQLSLYSPSELYVSELTIQECVSPLPKGPLANENSPADPIQNVGSVVRTNDRAHAHLISQP